MASFTWQELIDRARVYVDDDHTDDDSWLKPEQWLRLAFIEHEQLYKRWTRLSWTLPAIIDLPFNTGSITLDGVLAIVGVAHDDGSRIRLLEHCPEVIWKSTGAPTGDAWRYTVATGGDQAIVTLDPTPASGFSQYHVKYAALPDYTAFTANLSIELPSGGDERLVLGMAKRAHIKDRERSSTIEDLIRDADAEMHFLAASKIPGGPKVKVLKRSSTPRGLTLPNRSSWLWL